MLLHTRNSPRPISIRGKFADAESTYQQAIAVRPTDWGPHNILGSFYYRRGRFSEAAAQFRLVVELAPDNVRGLSNLGGMYQLMKQYREAEAVLKKSLEIRPSAQAYANLGTIYYFHLQDSVTAANMFERATEMDARNHQMWKNLAAAYYWSPGAREKARAAYRKAIEVGEEELATNPRDQGLLVKLADCYAMIDETGRALDYLARASRIAPFAVDQMATAAEIYEHIGQRALALDWVGKVNVFRRATSGSHLYTVFCVMTQSFGKGNSEPDVVIVP